MTRFRITAAAVALALVATSLPAAAASWTLLGQRHVTDKAERDTIDVTAKEGTFDAIQIRVKRSAVRLYRVTVVYGVGTSDDLELRDVIPAGGESRVLDLRGGDRVIKRIELAYEARSLGRRGALVEVYGRR